MGRNYTVQQTWNNSSRVAHVVTQQSGNICTRTYQAASASTNASASSSSRQGSNTGGGHGGGNSGSHLPKTRNKLHEDLVRRGFKFHSESARNYSQAKGGHRIALYYGIIYT